MADARLLIAAAAQFPREVLADLRGREDGAIKFSCQRIATAFRRYDCADKFVQLRQRRVVAQFLGGHCRAGTSPARGNRSGCPTIGFQIEPLPNAEFDLALR